MDGFTRGRQSYLKEHKTEARNEEHCCQVSLDETSCASSCKEEMKMPGWHLQQCRNAGAYSICHRHLI